MPTPPKIKAPPDPAPETDSLRISVFKLFTVDAKGRGVDHVPKVLPILFFGAIGGAILIALAIKLAGPAVFAWL